MNSLYASNLIRHEIWQDFIAHFKSDTTIPSYLADIDEIMNYFQKDFLNIGKKDIEKYFQKLQMQVEQDILKPSTMAKKFREPVSYTHLASKILSARTFYPLSLIP